MTAQRILLILGLIVVVARSDVRGDAEERTLKVRKLDEFITQKSPTCALTRIVAATQDSIPSRCGRLHCK